MVCAPIKTVESRLMCMSMNTARARPLTLVASSSEPAK
jgi:hypothetical protein